MEKLVYKYRRLFSIEIWHDYFLKFYRENEAQKLLNQLPSAYAISGFLEVRASEKTERAFRNFGLKFVPDTKGFSVYAQSASAANGEYKTLIPLDTDIRFTFEFFARAPNFLNYSNIPPGMAPHNILYFNNLEMNRTGDGNYLSRALDAYSSNAAYSVGDLVVNAEADAVYESIAGKSIGGGLEDPNKWMGFEYKNDPGGGAVVKGVQAVSSKDILAKQTGRFVFEKENVHPDAKITFALKDIFGNAVNLGYVPGTSIPQNEIQAPTDPNVPFRHSISLDHLPEGRYMLNIMDGTAGSASFYLFNSRRQRSPLGVISLFGDTPHPEYRFFEIRVAEGKRETIIRPTTFKIRFKNRSARWRYYENGDTSAPPKRTVIQPLTNNFIKLPGNLPNPDAGRIALSRNAENQEIEAIYSDIYLYDIKI